MHLPKKSMRRSKPRELRRLWMWNASLQGGNGSLPACPERGMFLIDGKSVKPLEQVGSQIKRDKKQYLKQVLSPDSDYSQQAKRRNSRNQGQDPG